MIDTWKEHIEKYYSMEYTLVDATKNKIDFVMKSVEVNVAPTIILINYDLIFRRKELLQLKDFCLILDESSLINNENAKRSKFILKLQAKDVILLSGTLCGGKYERLYSQLKLLGWKISKDLFWRQYIDTEIIDNQGFPIKVVRGYKNVDRLKQKLRDHNAIFMKTQEVFDLPEQVFNDIKISTTPEYRTFKRDRIVDLDDKTLIGDTTLTKMLYERQLCGSYNTNKLEALKDLLQSSDDRIIIFYNFNNELDSIKELCEELNRPVSEVNGQVKDLTNWNEQNNTILLGQYQAASMGLNLQQANKIIYFTPPLSSELFEQSKKRTHRIGQKETCFYYELICRNSIEEKIYKVLAERRDYTDKLFEEEED